MTLCSKQLSEHNSEDKRMIGEESGRDHSGLGTVSRSLCALVCHLWAVLEEHCREWKARGRREMSQSSLGRQISQTVGNHPTGARDSMFTGQMYAEEWVVSSTSNSKPGNHKLRLQEGITPYHLPGWGGTGTRRELYGKLLSVTKSQVPNGTPK